MKSEKKPYRNPWAWIPSLYLAQGIPYVVVMTVSVIMYKRLGISNTDIALYTSWLYLPWVLKPLWSPFVDLFRTKRFWVVLTQFIIGSSLALVAFTIPLPSFFQYTLAVFWLMAFSSATHDIAADGFYMLSLEQHQQAAFVGVRSTFYRVAMITGQGILVILAGTIEQNTGLTPLKIEVHAVQSAIAVPAADSIVSFSGGADALAVIPSTASLYIENRVIEKKSADSLIRHAKSENIRNAFVPKPSETVKAEPSWWDNTIAIPFGSFLRSRFGNDPAKIESKNFAGNVGIISFRLSQKPPAGKEIVHTFDFSSGDNSIGIVEGARLVFTDANWDSPAYAVIQLDPKLKKEVSASFSGKSGNIPLAWAVTFYVLAALFISLFLYHRFILPYPVSDAAVTRDSSKNVFSEFFAIFALFFKKKKIGYILLFLLFYRFAEAQLVKLVTPFLLDARDKGGLGLTTSEVGIVYGTVGIIALTAGGLLGGYVMSKRGLKFWLWIMAVVIHLPDLTFVYLSQVQPENFILINAAVALEQFGYGFGFTAYMLYMILVSEGEHKTAHYAICTGFMALGMMIPGMFSGWLQEHIGYQSFFLWVILSTIPGFLVVLGVKVDPEFGRKKV